jgi:hypothetical protein
VSEVPKTCFVSGHLDLTEEELATHYRPRLDAAIAEGASFIVGDARGCDAIVQAAPSSPSNSLQQLLAGLT